MAIVEFGCLCKSRLKSKNVVDQNPFHYRFFSEGAKRFFLILGFCILCGICFMHLTLFPTGEKLYANVVDLKSLMYSLGGLISAIVAGLGFGKPYSPMVVYMFGFVFNGLILGGILKMYGLFDWFDKFIPLVSCLVLYAEYFYRGRQRPDEHFFIFIKLLVLISLFFSYIKSSSIYSFIDHCTYWD